MAPSTTRLRGALLAALAAGAVLRLVLLCLDGVPFIYSDSGAYLFQAVTLAPAHDRPLGYALFLRAVLAVHDSLYTVVYVQTVLGLVMVGGFIWLAGRYVLTTTVGLLAFALLASLDLRTMLFERWILSEALSMFLLLPYFLLLFAAVQNGRSRSQVLLGVTVACLVLTRSVFTFLVPFTIAALGLVSSSQSAARARAALLCALGMLPLLLGYAAYYHQHHGRFALTSFDGFSLWAVAGHPSVCLHRPWDEPRTIVCRSPHARASTVRPFRAIWGEGPARDLQRHYQDPARVNDVLRALALESIARRPVAYLTHVVRFARTLFDHPIRFASHRDDQLLDAGARAVRQRYGPDHPSVGTRHATAWSALVRPMRVSRLYGVLLLAGTVAWLLPRGRRWDRTLLLAWLWAYVGMVAAFGWSDQDRFYVIMTMPLLLFLTSTAESIGEAHVARK